MIVAAGGGVKGAPRSRALPAVDRSFEWRCGFAGRRRPGAVNCLWSRPRPGGRCLPHGPARGSWGQGRTRRAITVDGKVLKGSAPSGRYSQASALRGHPPLWRNSRPSGGRAGDGALSVQREAVGVCGREVTPHRYGVLSARRAGLNDVGRTDGAGGRQGGPAVGAGGVDPMGDMPWAVCSPAVGPDAPSRPTQDQLRMVSDLRAVP